MQLGLVLTLLAPTFMHTQRERRALAAWTRSGSAEDEAVLRAEWARMERVKYLVKGVVLALLVGNTVLLFKVYPRQGGAKGQASGGGP